jgi:hypothetical protein
LAGTAISSIASTSNATMTKPPKERAKLLIDGHDVELWDGARKIAEFKTGQ